MEKRGIILVPYRDRIEHLFKFLHAMKGHDILIIEQDLGKIFNRGKLLNVGYVESPGYDYYIFHDVDMIPESADYSYPEHPTHIATQCSQFGYKIPYEGYFGGVSLINKSDFAKANGFPNEFWGWGGEDDEIRRRLLQAGLKIESRKCRFESLAHEVNFDPILHSKNVKQLSDPINLNDGLNSLEYEVLREDEIIPSCKKITVKI